MSKSVSLETSRLYFELKHLVERWYRDSSGNDITSHGNISIGSTLSYMLWQAGASILRYSRDAVARDVKAKPSKSFLKMTPLQSLVARHFNTERLGTQCGIIYPYLDEQYLKVTDICVPRSASLIRRVQPLFAHRIRQRRNLWITDWTTFHSSRKRPDSLVLYHRLPLRSAIPSVDTAKLRQFEKVFPSSIGHLFNQEVLLTFIDRYQYMWPEQSVLAISEYMQTKYLEIRPSLIVAATQIENMIDFYQPQSVCLPADAFETWNLWYQICHSRGIESSMYMDGYQVVPVNPMLRTQNDSDWLVSKVAAFGTAQTEMYANYGFPTARLETVESPFLLWSTKRLVQSHDYEAIVMTWIPNPVNPLSDSQSPATTLRSALRTLYSCGLTKIAIKIKHEEERSYVLRVVSELEDDIPILTGYFHHHVSSASLFVGGISTAIAEVAGRGLPYIVFEPLENGYPDELLTHSTAISVKSIARSPQQLAELISSQTTSWVGNPELNLLHMTS